ncbi:hypothetical protein CRD59_06420 [Bifidobacterium xylocopae]|uniref:Uncharacterized protein n=1 Tax=Bifidobacterium xylocopae TaxID=2493119 RepID=A0A366KB19_9BIFI|nr:hypothetical protein CRD59_06420 [Bifidobacterium xylocopae]
MITLTPMPPQTTHNGRSDMSRFEAITPGKAQHMVPNQAETMYTCVDLAVRKQARKEVKVPTSTNHTALLGATSLILAKA